VVCCWLCWSWWCSCGGFLQELVVAGQGRCRSFDRGDGAGRRGKRHDRGRELVEHGATGFDGNEVGIEAAHPQCGTHAGSDSARGHRAVQEQHSDQCPGPGAVAELGARCDPEPLVDGSECSTRASTGQCGRAGHRTGLAGQDLKVVVEHQVLAALVQRANVRGHDGSDRAGIEDSDRVRAEAYLEPPARVAGRDRVVGLTYTDPGLGIDTARQRGRDVEDLDRQRS